MVHPYTSLVELLRIRNGGTKEGGKGDRWEEDRSRRKTLEQRDFVAAVRPSPINV